MGPYPVATYAQTRRADPRIAAQIRAALGDARSVVNVGAGAGSYEPVDLEVVPVEPSPGMIAQRPATDGFLGAHWRRPEAYLDPVVRASISAFPPLGEGVRPGLERLSRDVGDGTWRRRHADLLALDELDVGYRLLVATAS